MKAVAFICLLSLSLSLSQPTQQATTDAHLTNTTEKPVQTTTDVKTADVKNAVTGTSEKANETQVQTATETKPQTPIQPMQGGKNETTGQTTTVKPVEKVENKTDGEKNAEKASGNQTAPMKNEKDDTKEENAKPTADGTQGAAKKNETTTEQTQVVTTEKAKDITEAPKNVQPVQSRAFDGPSFFGGIILTLGLLAIGFMGYKYYKNQTDGNYHTL